MSYKKALGSCSTSRQYLVLYPPPSEKFFDALREAVKIAYEQEMSGTMAIGMEAGKKIEKLKQHKEKILGLMVEEPELRDD